MRWDLLLLGAVVAVPCLLAAPDPPEAAPVAADAADVRDIVFLAEDRPVLVRLHITLDGKPFPARWEGFMKKFFAYLDMNGDGVLSRAEVERAPKADAMAGTFQADFFQGDFYRPLNNTVKLADIDTNR